tara:strand:+ start:258 stop:923 length:666 start_codon:yes stop_codon:yes gene_type:complete
MNDLFLHHFDSSQIRRPEQMLPDVPMPMTLYSMSCAVSAHDFFSLAKHHNITAILDTRLKTRYRGFGFATLDTDFHYLCELHGVAYYPGGVLAPTDDLRKKFHREFTEPKTQNKRNPNAWTEFLSGYESLLKERKPLQSGVVYDILYNSAHTNVAVVCSCLHHHDCHRSYACGVVSRYIPSVSVSILYPGGVEPRRKSPRRYRNVAFVHADLPVNSPSRGR